MKTNPLFKKYHKRIVKEGVLKSLFYGLIAGSCALLVTALFSWFFGFRAGLWLALGMFAVAFLATALPLYFFKFKPTTKQIAVRVDALGLEERLITMLELEGDDSYIATRQREDAVHAMKSMDSMLLKIVVSVALIVFLTVSLVVGFAGGTAVSSLYYADVIPSGIELIEGSKPVHTFVCTYKVASGVSTGTIVYCTDEWTTSVGSIDDPTEGLVPVEGDIEVKEGEDAPAVYAVPAVGYAFVCWSDGVRDPYRQDVNVKGNLEVSATFVLLGFDVEDIGQDVYFQPGPGDPSNNDGNGDGDGDNESGDGEGEGNSKGDDPANQRHDVYNQQIVDGQHYYGDSFEDAYNDAQDRLGSDSNISGDVKDVISDYYGNIGTGGSGEGSDDGSGGGSGLLP